MEPLQFNNLELRLATSAADLDAAQALRYRIFYEEMGATPTEHCRTLARDVDRYDEICDHLLVIDLEKSGTSPYVVGTYRFLRSSVAEQYGGFYTDDEFDLKRLRNYPGEIMELGRSCIDAAYRRRGAMQLLWRGIAAYILEHKVEVMFGCGSIHGVNLEESQRVLAYLHHFHRAPGHLRPKALPGRYVSMNVMKKRALDIERALTEMPPLLKGYLRLGGYVGEGAVIDHQFNTIDVCIIVETKNVTDKYSRHFIKEKPRAAVVSAAAGYTLSSPVRPV
jgi:putative hemolysin